MMEVDRRALYNSLRINWLLDPSTEAEPWQVADYRTPSLSELFGRLSLHEIHLNRPSFQAFAEEFDTPEELVDALLDEEDSQDSNTHDQVYLLVFELWRRLLPEKYCLSIFCDELDYQIHLYDAGKASSAEGIQDALANLQVILDEHTDQGVKPSDVFESISFGCANDIENFLIDFISEQIDNGNMPYASELIDDFSNYVQDKKWFDFLRARILSHEDPQSEQELIRDLIKKASKERDLEFNLELLHFLVEAGDQTVFAALAKKCIPLLEYEEDFQDLLTICAEFYHRLDLDGQEQTIQHLLKNRTAIAQDTGISKNDPDIAQLVKILS